MIAQQVKNTIDFWHQMPAEKYNEEVAKLPKAEEHSIIDKTTGLVDPDHKLIVVDGKIVDVPSKYYVLKQHDPAFRPVVEGMTLRGLSDWSFSLWSTPKKASLAIFIGEATDGVKFGFKVMNSFNRSTAISYNMHSFQQNSTVEIVEREHVLVYGYRQTCANGMIVRVPLKTCKYMDSVTVTRVKELFSQHTRIIHMGLEVDKKLETMQYLTEGFLLLKGPLDMMIIDAQEHKLTREQAKLMLIKYIGKRRLDKYLERFGMEEQTLWGLYNSITFLASHQESLTTQLRENLLLKASTILEKELMA